MSKELTIFMPGEMIFKEGDPSGGLYFIQAGRVDIFRERDGAEVNLGVLATGEILGTLTVFSGEPRTASARALNKVEVQYMSSGALSQGLSKIPVWALAIIKDAVARLKFVDELLVQSSLKERRLKQEVGNVFHHGAQVAQLLSFMVKTGTKEDEGMTVFPLKGFSAAAEPILNLRAEYIENIWQAFVKGGLVKSFEDKKWGEIIRSPKAKVYEDFGVFSARVAKKGTADFIPQKLSRWVGSLIRLSQKFPEKKSFPLELFIEAVGKDYGRTMPPEMVEVFKLKGLVRTQNSEVQFEGAVLQKRLVFEGTCQALFDLDSVGETEETGAA